MAISFHAGGAAAAGTTQCLPTWPTVNAGDMVLLGVSNKYPNNGPSTPTGFSAPSNNQQGGGSGSAGADTGTVYQTIYTKESDGTETGTITVDCTSGNSLSARAFSYSKSAQATWDVALAKAANNTASASWSCTPGSLDYKPGDVVLAFSTANTDLYTYSAEALAALGVTFGAATERMDATTGQGDDHARVMSEHPVTAGIATVSSTYTMTASGTATNNPAGSTVLVRLRESYIVTPPTASLATTKFAPVVREDAIPGVAGLVAQGFAPLVSEVVTPGVASLAATRLAPVLSKIATPPKASFVVTPLAPGVLEVVVVPTAALALTRLAPLVSKQVTPPAAALSVQGFAPVASEKVVVPTASLAASGLQPRADERVTPGAASLSISRFAPTVSVQQAPIVPGTANLSLSSFAPTVSISGTAIVPPAPHDASFSFDVRSRRSPAAEVESGSPAAAEVRRRSGGSFTVGA